MIEWPGTEIWKGTLGGPSLLCAETCLCWNAFFGSCQLAVTEHDIWFTRAAAWCPHKLNCCFFWLSGLCRPAPCQCSWDQADDGPAKNCSRYLVSSFVGKCLHMTRVQGVRKPDFRASFAAVTVMTGVQSRDTFSQVLPIFSYSRIMLIANVWIHRLHRLLAEMPTVSVKCWTSSGAG